RGDYDAALKDAQAGLNLEPENHYYLLALGDIYRAQKNYRNALLAYKRAIEKEPNNPDAYYFIAEAHFNLNDNAEQGISALEAIKRGTKYPGEAWFYVGDALQKGGKITEAVEAYQRAITANPKIYGAYNNLSEIYRNQGRLTEAIAIMEKAAGHFPDDGTIYVNLSWYYSLAEKHNDAVRAGQKAIQLAPDNYMAHTNLCRAYNDTKLYTQAIKTCQDALRLNPGDGETNFYLARAYDLSNKPDEATPFYKKAVTGLVQFTNNNPDYADGYYLLGNAYYADNQRDKAIEAYQKTLELSPKFSRARYNLGYLLFLKNDLRGAQAQVSALMDIDQNLANKLKQAIQK
ncbi:MAG TPA: tetratricopeptide repeat protein, partial [Pyrinomonadaceae bacterium]|nr:tetratricopeptide repeat protein [Pyrinomonadaceae bacterium]